jgi:hypothetical protein
VGRVEVDDVRDAHDVDAACGDVGGDEHVDRTRLEAGERLLALALGLVAVHRYRLDAVSLQALDQPVGAVLGPHEHERELAVVAELADERFDAMLMGDLDEPVLDVIAGVTGSRAVLVDSRLTRVLLGDAPGVAVECG